MTTTQLRLAAGVAVAAAIGLVATASAAAPGDDAVPRETPAAERTPPPAPRCSPDGTPPSPTADALPGKMVLLVCEVGPGRHHPLPLPLR